jgi:oligoribonuclease NrnB/cAMP/cGMP phosphodiesterase (DHH superfamily)
LFRSERRRQRRRLARWDAADAKAKAALLVSHGNCLDGVGAAVVTLQALGRDQVGVAYVQPGDMAHVLAHFAARPGRGRRFLVADLSLQPEQYDAIVEACRSLATNGWTVEWRDHHHKQWEGLDLSRLRAHLAALEVNADATESGASLQQKALAPDDPFLRRLAETVRDRDLWWNKTPDSETLEFALSDLGPFEFARHLLDAAGDRDAAVVTPALAQAARRERDAQVAAKSRLLSEVRTWGDGASKVGVVYGWLPKNTGLHEVLEDHGCRIAINVRPNGKASLRSRKDAPVCHLVARDFHGGGHPNASGADLGLKGPAFWWYVARRGRVPAVERMAARAVQALERQA